MNYDSVAADLDVPGPPPDPVAAYIKPMLIVTPPDIPLEEVDAIGRHRGVKRGKAIAALKAFRRKGEPGRVEIRIDPACERDLRSFLQERRTTLRPKPERKKRVISAAGKLGAPRPWSPGVSR